MFSSVVSSEGLFSVYQPLCVMSSCLQYSLSHQNKQEQLNYTYSLFYIFDFW
jgi:hypothetical protein